MKKSLILFWYHVLSLWNWRSVYLGRLIEPVAYFIFLVVGVSGMLSRSSSSGYVEYALVGIFCLLVFRVFTSTVSDVANDRKWGVYAIFSMQGGSAVGYLISIVAVTIIIFGIQFMILLIVYSMFYFRTLSSDLLLSLCSSGFVGAVICCGWSGLGAAIGARVNNYSTRDMIGTLVSLPVVLSAPLFYRLDTAPSYLKLLAKINPLTYQVTWMRNSLAVNISLSVVWALGGLAIGWLALRNADRISTER